jgi:hypothetical protein
MFRFDSTVYGPALAAVLPERLNDLGPGSPTQSMAETLRALSPERAFGDRAIRNRDMAYSCLAGLWLYHDFLEESHRISQSIHTPTGSYWHGLMHRREPDDDNSKYWFRRVGRHPVFEALAPAATALVDEFHVPQGARSVLCTPDWNPFQFIDIIASCRGDGSATEQLCRRIQQCEWQLLFDYCYRQAVGRS